jgi:uncharacterized Zn finger protein (UPF0148 family)
VCNNDLNNIVNGELFCPTCQIPLLEKVPKDKRQFKKVVRFFCPCGYYFDVTIQELKERRMDMLIKPEERSQAPEQS